MPSSPNFSKVYDLLSARMPGGINQGLEVIADVISRVGDNIEEAISHRYASEHRELRQRVARLEREFYGEPFVPDLPDDAGSPK